MATKRDLLKEVGWSDQLIDHFMVDDSESHDRESQSLRMETFDTHSMTLTFNMGVTGSDLIIK